MAVKEAAKEVGKGLVWGAPGFVATIMKYFASLDVPKMLALASLIYTVILILRQIPRCIGCAHCFIKNRTCNNRCKG